jgi:hypothetical protein
MRHTGTIRDGVVERESGDRPGRTGSAGTKGSGAWSSTRVRFGRVSGDRVARWFALAFLGGTIGCATVGHEFSPSYVPQITIGQTSKSDMRLMFGEPYRRGIDDGDSTWTYVHYKFRLFGEHMKTRDLLIRWNKDDRVRSYSYNSNMD